MAILRHKNKAKICRKEAKTEGVCVCVCDHVQVVGREERNLTKDQSPSMKTELLTVTIIMTKDISLKEIFIRHFHYWW